MQNMLKTLLMLFVALSMSLTATFAAAVEVNTADQAALESVKGLGPVKSKAIIDERAKNGPFKSADDLANRVKGLGQKSVANLEAAGLTIGGSTAPPTGAKPAPTAGTRATKTQAGTSTGTPTPAPTAATPTTATPAPASAADTATKPARGKRAKKQDKAATAAGASAASAPAATAAVPAAGSAPKAKGSRKSKKNQAASAATGASGT